MDRTSFESWLEAYGRAWRDRNPQAAANLFAEDGTYQVTPFVEGMRSRAAILEYWSHVPQTEQEIQFGYEADPAVSVRLIAYMHNMGCTPHLLGGVPRYFRRHSNRHFQRHSDLQGRRRREEKTTTGNIQGLCKMLSLVRSYPSRSESQRRAVVEPGPLSTLNSFHFVLPHARKGLKRILAN